MMGSTGQAARARRGRAGEALCAETTPPRYRPKKQRLPHLRQPHYLTMWTSADEMGKRRRGVSGQQFWGEYIDLVREKP